MPDRSPVSALLSGRGRRWTHAVGWMAFYLIIFVLISEMRGWQEALFRTTFNFAVLIGIFYFNARILVNRLLEKGHWGAYLISVLGLLTVLSVVRYAIEQFVAGQLLPQQTPQRLLIASFVVYLLVVLLSGVYQLLENRHHAELKAHAWEARHAEAQLSYLRARINPHFLFNTLHNIYAAASLQLPQTADMILKLSQLLRYVTYDAQVYALPLDLEWTHLERYVELYRMRAGGSINLNLVYDRGEGTPWFVAPMLLLPLVENALKHSNLEFADDAFVDIRLETTSDVVHFCVRNSFDPADRQRDAQGGVGLENIRQRLHLLYPNAHTFSAQAHEQVFLATLTLNHNLDAEYATAAMPVG
ncbi:MAG: sensor histidine kinase [Saprospiraceae bacterium]|nr:sensor histidine kinase [Saprospiraceae bacterium]